MASNVSLQKATPDDALLLSNLLELYIHDMSEVFPEVSLGVDGRFGYPQLAHYWAEPADRHAYIVKADGRVAGFVLAKRQAQTTGTQDMWDVSEFFVLRQFRRSHVGRNAAFKLWDTLRGQWMVRVLDTNRNAKHFWNSVIADYAGANTVRTTREDAGKNWIVRTFASRPS